MTTRTQTSMDRLDSLIAGGVAGGLESATTFPTEHIKTRQQLADRSGRVASPWVIVTQTVQQPNTLRALYGGAGPFVLSNAAKSAVRFFVFGAVKDLMPYDAETSKSKSSSILLAGLAAGVAESVLAVTPGETLETKLIDDWGRPGGPQFRSSLDAIRKILAQYGPSGLYKGVVPVILKQSTNSMVRFTSYSFICDLLERHLTARTPGIQSAVAGAMAGVVTVCASQPFDVLKTRMQVLSSSPQSQSMLA